MLECLTPWNLVWNFFHAHQCAELYAETSLTDPFSFLEYLPYFLKTYILELPVYWFFLKKQTPFLKICFINLILNLSTHPIVFFVIPILLTYVNATYLHYLVCAEIFAPLIEALVLIYIYKINLNRAFLAALAANLFSWSLGIFWI